MYYNIVGLYNICMYVCMYVYMSVCMHVYMLAFMYVHIHRYFVVCKKFTILSIATLIAMVKINFCK